MILGSFHLFDFRFYIFNAPKFVPITRMFSIKFFRAFVLMLEHRFIQMLPFGDKTPKRPIKRENLMKNV